MRWTNNICAALIAIGLSLGLAGGASAALIDQGVFDGVSLIFDDTQGITWLGDANFGAGSTFDNGFSTTDGRMTWQNAMDWAASLTVGGFTDWRLPTTTQPDPTCVTQINGEGFGQGCTGSELGHLKFADGVTSTSSFPFTNVGADFYWSSTEYAPNPTTIAWGVGFGVGQGQALNAKSFELPFAWAVRPGDSLAAAPEPGTLFLLGTGLVGLVVRVRRR